MLSLYNLYILFSLYAKSHVNRNRDESVYRNYIQYIERTVIMLRDDTHGCYSSQLLCMERAVVRDIFQQPQTLCRYLREREDFLISFFFFLVFGKKNWLLGII